MDKLKKTINDIEYGKDLLQNRPEQDTVDYKLYDILNDSLELLIQGRKAIRDIDLYIADIQDDLKKPSRSMRNYERGMCYGLSMAKEILEGKRNHG